MSKNIASASLVVVVLALWLASGQFGAAESKANETETASTPVVEEQVPASRTERVRVSVIDAEPRTRQVVLRGRTESKRIVDVKAEISGNVVSRPVERGMEVAKGDLLCEVAIDDREVALEEAKAAFETARIEHEGSLRLEGQGLLSDVAIANSEARQEAARANLHRQELNLARTRIEAPFAGVIEDLHMNVGDYAVPGAACATLIDLDPMLVIADVSEGEVESLNRGQTVSGLTTNGRNLEGTVSFVGKQSDATTRTYPVEITVANADYSIRSGLTVTLRIGVEQIDAHKISPSLLSLNDAGQMGVRILDESNRVVFKPVTIIEDGVDGMWITGLPGTVNLITVGQEYVALGDIVEPVLNTDAKGQVAGL